MPCSPIQILHSGKCFLILLLVSCTSLPIQAQVFKKAVNLYHRYLGDSVDESKPRFLAYPTIGYSPETTWEFGVSSVFVFSAHNDFKRNRLSEITAFGFYTLKHQYGIWSDHAIYTDLDKWFFLGRDRYQDFPLLYWGTGPNTREEEHIIVQGRYLLLRQRVLRKLAPNLFLGPEVDYQNLFRTRFEYPDQGGAFPVLPPGSGGSGNLGFGGALVYDDRHNYLNVRRGTFMELAMLRYSHAWGSDYSFYSALVDARLYRTPFAEKQTWATQVYGQFIPAGQAPFNQLSLLGNESLLCGYYTGRFRDRHYLAAQTEYRFLPFPFSKRFGGTVFAAAGVVGPNFTTLVPKKAVWAAGGGLRFLILPKKDIFVRFDAGFTREGHGFYLFLGEAF